MSTIAVIGANGTIGSRIVREALERGHQVTAVVRNPASVTEQHPNLTVTTGDVLDPASVAGAATGHQVLVSAVGGDAANISSAARSVVAGLRLLGEEAPRLIQVGGAGSLRTPDGSQVWDAPGFPDWLLPIAHAHGDALDHLRTVTDVTWTSFSPAGTIAPGERTGSYRTDREDLVVDAEGASRISTEDYAAALVDEIEDPAHLGERFTVGY
ncbi:NAD(P)-dependent oxidoreductase [Kitasatospora viridis]|uniref:NAD(P)-binding domain-containing protein n=1 Tax=Kitasatospora viridis TaxID=281105 RepID=A0A561UPE1_9ACTN|nr:NAD(P)H-binding protein [Kitasatospora viridis]TWG01238.1 hypothetical protein FHX73_115130 [Kitasatospora viridis]